MTTSPAAEWLQADFENTARRYRRNHGHGPSLRRWHGPSYIRPIIQLRSITDGGTPMHVACQDYDDPERWWL